MRGVRLTEGLRIRYGVLVSEEKERLINFQYGNGLILENSPEPISGEFSKINPSGVK